MLRIGLLLDGYEVDAWESRMFQEITECSYAEIVLVVRNASPRASHNPRLIDKLTRNFGRITTLAVNKALTTVYEKVIDRTTYLPDATVKVSCEELLKEYIERLRLGGTLQ